MESSGEVGKVNISEATYELVKDVKKVNGEWELVNGEHVKTAIGNAAFQQRERFTVRLSWEARAR